MSFYSSEILLACLSDVTCSIVCTVLKSYSSLCSVSSRTHSWLWEEMMRACVSMTWLHRSVSASSKHMRTGMTTTSLCHRIGHFLGCFIINMHWNYQNLLSVNIEISCICNCFMNLMFFSRVKAIESFMKDDFCVLVTASNDGFIKLWKFNLEVLCLTCKSRKYNTRTFFSLKLNHFKHKKYLAWWFYFYLINWLIEHYPPMWIFFVFS